MRRLMPAGRAAALCLFAAGCGGDAKVYPVEGVVAYPDGSPAADLKGYKVEFEAVDGKIKGRGVSAEGEIGADGRFRVTTLQPGDGALAGRHRVLIAPPVPEGDTTQKPYAVDKKYVSYETSGLTATIEPKANQITLTIDRRKN